MGIFSWIIMGLIVGALAKFLMPGEDPGGIFVTIAYRDRRRFYWGFCWRKNGIGNS